MIALRLVWALLTWIVYEAICMPLYVIGLFACVVAVEFGHYERSPITGLMIYTAPDWLWLYGNIEDGYQSDTVMRLLPKTWTLWRTMYWWAAIRNPLGNLRFVRALHPPQRADLVRRISRGDWMLVWQGPFSRLIWNNKNRINRTGPWFAIGWKYEPEAKDAEGWQAYGQGFGFRWVRR